MQNMTQYDPVVHCRAQYDAVRPCWNNFYCFICVSNSNINTMSVVFVTVGHTEDCQLVTKAKLR